MHITPPTGYSSISPLLKNHRIALPAVDRAPDFVRNTHTLPLSFAEISPASRDYPVAFLSTDGGKSFTLTAVLGLQHNQNMFLMGGGYWDRRVYLPAYVRRYPFCIASVPRDGEAQNERVVCVEDAAIRPDGEVLFDDKGEALPSWSEIENFVTEYERDLIRADEFCKLLVEFKMLEPISVTAEVDEFKMQLAGLYRVQREVLADLPESSLRLLLQGDAMDAVFAHLSSLSNFQRMLSRRSVFSAQDSAVKPN